MKSFLSLSLQTSFFNSILNRRLIIIVQHLQGLLCRENQKTLKHENNFQNQVRTLNWQMNLSNNPAIVVNNKLLQFLPWQNYFLWNIIRIALMSSSYSTVFQFFLYKDKFETDCLVIVMQLILCHKLKCSNLYILETWWCKPLIVKTKII